MKRWFLLGAILLPLPFLISADRVKPVSIVVEHGPYLGMHMPTARLRVTVEPNKLNRGLWTAIEADGYAAASYEDLAGASAPKTRWKV